MTGLVKSLAVKFLKAKWGAILPAVFKAAAEGQLSEPVQRVYWVLAKYKTFTGAVLWAAGTGLEATCSNYPTMAWSCTVAPWIYHTGAFLTIVGLADGGTRARWPEGAQKEQREG